MYLNKNNNYGEVLIFFCFTMQEPAMFVLRSLLLLLSLPLVAAAAYSEYSCNGTNGNYTASDAFGANLERLTTALPINASISPSLFASAAIGAAPDVVFGLALCRGDITEARTCSSCLNDAFQRLRALCAGDRDATFYHDLCTLRYSGEDFLARPDDNSPVINAMDVNGSTYAGWDSQNATSRTFFLSLVDTLFSEMAMYGAYNSTAHRFASAVMYINPQLPTVYGLVQCTPDLSSGQCWHCFQGLQEQNRQWYDGREGGRILGVRCNFRYEGYQFYSGTPDVRIGLQGGTSSPTGNNGNNHRKILIIVLCVSITVFCSMLLGCLLLIRRLRKGAGKKKPLQVQAHSRNSSKTEEALKLWKIEESSSEFTLYDFFELAAATDNFEEENRLGRGGFGPVFRGKLPDGAEIAVKRLAAQSGQGLKEFKNEIQLIAKLQHTNLVKLLGCCVQEEEKILVYEYMPNRSLDSFIFAARAVAGLEETAAHNRRDRAGAPLPAQALSGAHHSPGPEGQQHFAGQRPEPQDLGFRHGEDLRLQHDGGQHQQGRRHLWLYGSRVRFGGHLLRQVRRLQLRRVAAGDRQRQKEQWPPAALRRLRESPRIRMAAVEGRESLRADRPDAGRLRRGDEHHAVRQGGAAVRAGQRDGPADDDGRDGDAGQRRRGAAGPEAASALPPEGHQRRRGRVGGPHKVELHRVVQHQRRDHHRHRRRKIAATYIYSHGEYFTIISLHSRIPSQEYSSYYTCLILGFTALNRPTGLRWGPPLQHYTHTNSLKIISYREKQ